jgi:uncharacterized protein
VSFGVVRFAETPSTAWKNGLGTTTQLAIHPATADQSTFEWRVSIATLTGTAPFSSFPGVERCLAMLEGEVTLLRDAGSVTLSTTSAPFTFSGEELVTGRVESGSAIDLNLMYRPRRWGATMRRIALREGTPLRARALTMVCAITAARFDVDGRRITLNRFDSLRVATPNLPIVAATDAVAYAIELQERAA